MKTIYSILYITLNAALNEKVSVGIIMSNGNEHFFKFSNDKLSIFKSILEAEKYSLVKKYLLGIEKDLGVDSHTKNKLFRNDEFRASWVTEGYITYLSRYSNNIIQFSQPKSIDIEFSYNNFRRLFEKYIYKFDELVEKPSNISIHAKVKEYLFPKIEGRVNLEMTLTATNFENLFAPIEVDFLGMNCIPVTGQTIDFSKTHYYLENDITRFISLTKAIELDGNDKGKYYILGREPEKNSDKNHLLWEHIRDSDFLEFVDVDEVGIVEEYIEFNNVRPYFQE